jgi:hypothetical protein
LVLFVRIGAFHFVGSFSVTQARLDPAIREDVQLATFGRRLVGVDDTLFGYWQSPVAIDDPDTHHPIVALAGKSEDRAPGSWSH